MKNIRNIFALLLSIFAIPAHATFVFSNVSYTANSVMFTIDGDMSGYSAPSLDQYEFSIRYIGDIWTGKTTHSQNTWIGNIFDNKTILSVGNTGGYETVDPLVVDDYSWVTFDSILTDAFSTANTVKVLLGDDYLDTSALSGGFDFLWGNGIQSRNATILGYVDVADMTVGVPEPSSLAILGIGLACIGLIGLGFRSNKHDLIRVV